LQQIFPFFDDNTRLWGFPIQSLHLEDQDCIIPQNVIKQPTTTVTESKNETGLAINSTLYYKNVILEAFSKAIFKINETIPSYLHETYVSRGGQ
jgi:hypothetical protein